MSGVNVSISPKNLSTTTDSDGKYLFENLSPELYTVTAKKEGYKTETKKFTVTVGETAPGDIPLAINVAPIAEFTFTPQTGTTNTTFAFDASGSSDDNDASAILQVRWRWSAGEIFTGWTTTKTADYKYASTGAKTITLEVKDSEGLVGSKEYTLTVSQTGYITANQPNAATVWNATTVQDILYDDNIAENVKIELYKADTWQNIIIASTPSNGTFQWAIPNTITTAADYKIKISSIVDNAIIGTSQPFTINEIPKVTVTSPNSNSQWQMGEQKQIVWTDNFNENVKIDLFKTGSFIKNIVAFTASNGTFLWTVPTNLTAGADYKVKITNVIDNNIADESEYFSIVEIPYISISKPDAK